MRRWIAWSTAVLSLAVTASLLHPGDAAARPVHHHRTVQKTHRILAGSKTVRIDKSGAVITNERP